MIRTQPWAGPGRQRLGTGRRGQPRAARERSGKSREEKRKFQQSTECGGCQGPLLLWGCGSILCSPASSLGLATAGLGTAQARQPRASDAAQPLPGTPDSRNLPIPRWSHGPAYPRRQERARGGTRLLPSVGERPTFTWWTACGGKPRRLVFDGKRMLTVVSALISELKREREEEGTPGSGRRGQVMGRTAAGTQTLAHTPPGPLKPCVIRGSHGTLSASYLRCKRGSCPLTDRVS